MWDLAPIGRPLQQLMDDFIFVDARKGGKDRKEDFLVAVKNYNRLGYELGFYNSTRYRELAERLNEIGRMTGAWLKSLQPPSAPPKGG